MGYISKIQHVQRPTNQSFYITLPSVLAQALEIEKGESIEWLIENKHLLLLKRVKEVKEFKSKKGVLTLTLFRTYKTELFEIKTVKKKPVIY
jgi:antitoxin component of MazEF toxin-antitoxin module